MKVLSLLQPWATLVVIGAKQIETRSWNTKYRGPLLIHASKKMSRAQMDLTRSDPFWSKLKHLGELPLGSVIGVVNLIETGPTEHFITISNDRLKYGWAAQVQWDSELQFGDYSPGRFGWLLKDPVAFTHQHPTKGSLSLWDFDLRICVGCGCMDHDCRHCIEKTGQPCHWVSPSLCSACVK